jgi:hypothetical protein
MEEKLLNKLGKIAYEKYFKVDEPNDGYFKQDTIPWTNLPKASKERWKEIAKAIVLASWNLDVGDLED